LYRNFFQKLVYQFLTKRVSNILSLEYSLYKMTDDLKGGVAGRFGKNIPRDKHGRYIKTRKALSGRVSAAKKTAKRAGVTRRAVSAKATTAKRGGTTVRTVTVKAAGTKRAGAKRAAARKPAKRAGAKKAGRK
jgi:hypothetical protein